MGEIILIVLGIMIALSINNRNEEMKSRSFELKMLREIQVSIQQDTAYFKMLLNRLRPMNEACIALV